MIPVELLWAVVALFTVLVVAVAWVQQRRVVEVRVSLNRTRDQLAFDEELLAELRGPRRSPACDDLQRGGF